MWNCDWEYQHQDVLKNCYERKMAGRPYGKSDPVRKIICEGCGCVFYTRIWSKKYCYYKKCGNGVWRSRPVLRSAKCAGTHSRPSGQTRSIVAMPAASGRIVRVLRIKQVVMMTTCSNRNGTRFKVLRLDIVEINSPTIIRNADAAALQINQVVTLTT